ncbi:MAG: UvrD-helicase domain-containing protein [Bacteroidales bacterium]|nr:UvrD-helicase domain-containing protein [Bacteroidales bacterium]
MSVLTIAKASAGSGKTTFLTGEILRILVKRPWAFKNILAVTFTNKAANEMKERVIEELYTLSVQNESIYLHDLKKALALTDKEIFNRSKQALGQILNNYGQFSIVTIDSFFQQVFKAFLNELGIHAQYEIELDTASVLNQAADNLLNTIDNDNLLLSWVTQLAIEKIESASGWDFKQQMLGLGKQLFSEGYINMQVNRPPFDLSTFNKLKTRLKEKVGSIELDTAQRAKAILDRVVAAGYEKDQFKGKKNSIVGKLEKIAGKDLNVLPESLGNYLEAEGWAARTHKKYEEIIQFVSGSILPLYTEFYKEYNKTFCLYNTCAELLKNLYAAGILADLQASVKQLCQATALC